jgi:hypothetical protein
MKLNDAITLLEADFHYNQKEQLEAEIITARASDLMSEVLVDDSVPDILLTGICNTQVIRTASVFGIKAVIFVRGKTCNQKMINLAAEENVVVMTTSYSLFTSCGKLYNNGIRGALEFK